MGAAMVLAAGAPPGGPQVRLYRAFQGGGAQQRSLVGSSGELFLSTAALGILTYLVAFLVRTYGMTQGDAALPLGVVGAGAILGSLLGGYVTGRKRRLSWAAFVLLLDE